MSRYLNNILLALVWAALTGSFTLANFVLGLLLGWLALYLVREAARERGAGAIAAAGYCRSPCFSSRSSFCPAGAWRGW